MQNYKNNNKLDIILAYIVLNLFKAESYVFRILAFSLLTYYNENKLIEFATFFVALEILFLSIKKFVKTGTNLLVEIRKFFHVVFPDNVRIISFNDDNNGTTLLKTAIMQISEVEITEIGEEEVLKERVKKLQEETKVISDVKKLTNGNYLINGENEYSLKQLKNNLSANKSKLNPEKPSKSVVDRIEYFTEILRIVNDLQQQHNQNLITENNETI